MRLNLRTTSSEQSENIFWKAPQRNNVHFYAGGFGLQHRLSDMLSDPLLPGQRSGATLRPLLLAPLPLWFPLSNAKKKKKQSKKTYINKPLDVFVVNDSLQAKCMFLTNRFFRFTLLLSAEDGGGGGLNGEELQPAQRFLLAPRLIHSGHLLLVHFLLQLLEEVRHLHLLVVPQPVALRVCGEAWELPSSPASTPSDGAI